MCWLKLEQPSNIELMSVTYSTFQSLMSWLKLAQPLNIELMFVTFETSQPLISSSKAKGRPESRLKRPLKFVRVDANSQLLILPYVSS